MELIRAYLMFLPKYLLTPLYIATSNVFRFLFFFIYLSISVRLFFWIHFRNIFILLQDCGGADINQMQLESII